VLLDVTLALTASTPEAVRAEADRVNRTRAAGQPKGGHSSGCVFRNAPEAPAGRLIDECGLKGLRRGGAFVSPTHGNFIINDGSASAKDILLLIEDVRAEVRRQKGVELQLEIRVWRGSEGERA
jgi:UDP-N-acetylmuramate dehydrogenase